jgi:dienelactone hydrolase
VGFCIRGVCAWAAGTHKTTVEVAASVCQAVGQRQCLGWMKVCNFTTFLISEAL